MLVRTLLFVCSLFISVVAHAETDHQAAERVMQEYGCMVTSAVWEFGACEAPSYFLAQMLVESAGRPDAVSSADARGLMQVKPMTLDFIKGKFPDHSFGDDLHDPSTGIRAGVAYHCYIKHMHKNGTKYDNAAEVAMGYFRGHNGGERYSTEEAHRSDYYQRIERYARLLPGGTMCRYAEK
jgi:hypothetical protein